MLLFKSKQPSTLSFWCDSLQIQRAIAFQGQCLMVQPCVARVHAYVKARRAVVRAPKTDSPGSARREGLPAAPSAWPDAREPIAGSPLATTKSALLGETAPWEKVDMRDLACKAAGGHFSSVQSFTSAVVALALQVLSAVAQATSPERRHKGRM
jgi:hypothetical protein